jgi:hypothetical protein
MNTTESNTQAIAASLTLIDIGIILLLPFAFSNVLCRHARSIKPTSTCVAHEAFNLLDKDNDKRNQLW